MKKFVKVALWTLVAAMLPATAFAQEAHAAGSSLGPALGAGLAIGLRLLHGRLFG